MELMQKCIIFGFDRTDDPIGVSYRLVALVRVAIKFTKFLFVRGDIVKEGLPAVLA